jgi:hypothetical protein
MAKISSYPILSTPTLNDMLIGTDVENFNETKNFLISDIAAFILADDYVPYLGANRDLDLGINSFKGESFIVNGGFASDFLKADGTLDSTVYQPQGNYITQLSGEASGSGPGNANITLSNNAVTGKVLTGLNVTGSVITSSDSILSAFGKVQNQINTLVGGVQYQGTWNADTNTPTLTSSVGVQGYYYVVSVPGSTNLNGITDWKLGDWAIFNGSSWDKVDNTDAVISVNGQIGAVVLTTTNISEGTNLYYTDIRVRGAVSLTNTGNSGPATYNNLTGQFNIPEYTLTGLGGVPLTREITINGTTFDLSANRTYNVGTVTSIGTTGPITGGTITGSGTIGITQSSLSTDGYLSSIDWNTFNNKQNALTNPVTGTGTAYTLPMWSNPTELMDSPLSYASNEFTFEYNSVSGGIVNFTNIGLSPYTYSISMNNFGSPRSTVHNYTSGLIINSIAGTQVSKVFQNGNTIFGSGLIDNGYKLEVSGSAYVDSLTLNPNPSIIPTAQGSLYFDQDEQTVAAVLNGSVMKIGEDLFFQIKNQSGVTIPKGTAVRFDGVIGSSGRVLAVPFLADGTYPSIYFLGVTSETILDGEDGKAYYFGKIRGLNTNVYSAGTILYASTTVAGGFQTTPPIAPNNIISVAAVVTQGVSNGTILVRPILGSNINNDEGVKIVSPVTGDLLQLQSNGLWENKSVASLGLVPQSRTLTINGTLFDLTANRSWSVGTITSLTGEATASGSGAVAVTLNNTSVISKVLTGLNVTGGTVISTDSILSAFGKVQNQINGLIGGSIFQGTWNASTNTPSLASSVGTNGHYYIVSVAGSTNLNGITDWQIGDWAIFAGTTWQKVDNTDAVSSVNGYTGTVSLVTGDVLEGAGSLPSRPSQLYFTDARARASLSFAAGSGAYNNTTGVITIPTNTNQLTNGSSFITLASLSGVAPIGYNNTTGAISITQAGVSSNGFLSSTDWTTFNNKIGGSGTLDYIAKFTAGGTVGDSQVFDNGTNVGIGTTSPTGKLSITETGTSAVAFDLVRLSTASGGNFNIQCSDLSLSVPSWTIQSGNLEPIIFSQSANERMRISSEGNVGIGTTSPSSELEISKQLAILRISDPTNYSGDGTNFKPAIEFFGNLGHPFITSQTFGALARIEAVYNNPLTTFVSETGRGNLVFSTNTGGSTAANIIERWRINYLGILQSNGAQTIRTSTGNLTIATGGDDGNILFTTVGSERMRITSDGNVGIGTTAPSSLLHVRGSSSLSAGSRNLLARIGGASSWGLNSFEELGVGYNGIRSVYDGNGWSMDFTSGLSASFVAGTQEARMRITSDGNVGIGTSSPSSLLTVSAISNATITLNGTDGSVLENEVIGNLEFYSNDSDGPHISGFIKSIGGETFGRKNHLVFGTSITNNQNAVEVMRITSGGEVYIAGTTDRGAFNLQVNGTGVWGAGAYVNGSDLRLKNSITPLSNSLDLINKLNPVSYKYNEDYSKDQSIQTGFIAQDLQKVFKNELYLEGLVKDRGQYLSVAYQNIIPLLVKAIQEQQIQIEELKSLINI